MLSKSLREFVPSAFVKSRVLPLGLIMTALTDLKEYKEGCLVHVGKKVFSMILEVEIMFTNISDSTLMAASNLNKLLVDKAEKLTENVQFLNCHDIKRKLLSKYFRVRLQIFCKKVQCQRRKEVQMNKGGAELGSKSMTMRKLVKHLK